MQQLSSMHKELSTEFILYITCLTLSFSFETSSNWQFLIGSS